ncbi:MULTISPECIES: hypothetical protein [unclassified Borrelia]|uniref:hypothetical protein n=1 Tax=unclassified Borrelia TaxID=2649934 RepID=UPI001E39E896|nr:MULTISPECIES: hypothetical protein [unclassified Borrelia]UGQ16580.1 hypothetical protein LSO06_04505 [Borrelia sp. RT5S]UGQ17750.1 hypothetical protein LSO05_04800 [Borrelia sp. RT1S]
MKIFNKSFYFRVLLTLNFGFLHSNSFETLKQEYQRILENYNSGVTGGFAITKEDDYINHYINKLKAIKESLELLKDDRTKYFNSDINSQIASMVQHAKGISNSYDSYSILVSTKKNLLDLISSEVFKGLEKSIRSDSYRILGDVNLSLLRYLGGGELIKVSNEAKNALEKSLEIDQNALASISLSTWFLYSPRIAGGNPREAIKLALAGLAVSNNKVEKYLANIWVSQGYFLLKKQKEQEKYLREAANIFPNGAFHKMVRDKNKIGELP